MLVRRSVARGVAIGALLLGTLLWLGTPVFADSDSTKAPDVADGGAARSVDASREHKDREHKDKDESKEKGPPDRNSPDDGGVCPP